MNTFRSISRMRIKYRLPFRATKKLVILIIVLIFLYVSMSPNSENKVINRSSLNYEIKSKRTVTIEQHDIESLTVKKIKRKKQTKLRSMKKIDWHNHTFIKFESTRVGLGEQGKEAILPNQDTPVIRQLIERHGYNVELADKIALNRSLPDLRHPNCRRRLYLESLPKVSVIVIFHNEHLTTLLRTVWSILNRTPNKLIKELFLVDDASTKDSLKEKLENYIEDNWPIVQLVRLEKRGGIVGARLAGAKLATAEVLVFLDSHMEVNVNWLPPLLEPIALNHRTSVVPIIDYIDPYTYKYLKLDDGARGGLCFVSFNYLRIQMLPQDEKNLPEPFPTPIMNGGAFAISRRFFWKLGGFDTGIKIWGCEQFELSLKIWQCGGRLLEAPCSRVGHVYRNVVHPIPDHGSIDYFFRNLRRVADVWMDEYAEMKYKMLPEYVKYDPGDLTEQKALRRKLKCKPFRWFMTQIAFDLLQQYPMEERIPYAEGRITSMANPHLCVDSNNGQCGSIVIIKECHSSARYKSQYFVFTWHNDIQVTLPSDMSPITRRFCLDADDGEIESNVKLRACHGHGGSQQWRYLPDTKLLVSWTKLCLDHDPELLQLFLNSCDSQSATQQWDIGIVRMEELKKWNESNTIWYTEPAQEWNED